MILGQTIMQAKPKMTKECFLKHIDNDNLVWKYQSQRSVKINNMYCYTYYHDESQQLLLDVYVITGKKNSGIENFSHGCLYIKDEDIKIEKEEFIKTINDGSADFKHEKFVEIPTTIAMREDFIDKTGNIQLVITSGLDKDGNSTGKIHHALLYEKATN